MRLRDAHGEARRLGVRLVGGELLRGLGRVVHAVAAVDLLHLLLDAVGKRLVEVAEEGEFVRLVAGGDHGVREVERAFAALQPVVAHGEARAGAFCHAAHEVALGGRVGVERVEAHDRLHAAAADDVDVREQVVAALLEQAEVLVRVDGVERKPRLHGGRAAVRLEGADGRDEHDGVGLQA